MLLRRWLLHYLSKEPKFVKSTSKRKTTNSITSYFSKLSIMTPVSSPNTQSKYENLFNLLLQNKFLVRVSNLNPLDLCQIRHIETHLSITWFGGSSTKNIFLLFMQHKYINGILSVRMCVLARNILSQSCCSLCSYVCIGLPRPAHPPKVKYSLSAGLQASRWISCLLIVRSTISSLSFQKW